MRKLKNSELNRKTISDFKKTKKKPIIIVLDNIRSLNNIGSVFRTSDAFLVNCIYLCGITAKPPHKDIHKTALGATDSVDWKYFETTKDAIIELKEKNYQIVSIEQAENSVELQDFKVKNKTKYAFVFGHEVKGVQQEIINLSNSCIEIPQYGTKHSFNISVSTGIVLWDIFNKI
ncbi:MAG: RNA methyltransferase [Bacteroidota bacterium]|nr:RNA methyltransferase [Bacteroidota bacterium]